MLDSRLGVMPAILAHHSKEMAMKLKLVLAASLFAIMAALSLTASAASDATAEAKVEKTASPQKIKPHSHMQDKTGIPQKAPDAMADKSNAAKDKTRHFHPRDAK
jgi:hypothetical protein